jgi:hypothetical protein
MPPFATHRGPSKKELLRSSAWAAAITAPVCLFGALASMGLAHSGGPLLVLFAPMLPVFMLFGSGGPFGSIPEWLFSTLLVVAQFFGTLAVVILVRAWRGNGDA